MHQVADVVDLSGCNHLKPYTVACLCGLAELAKSNGSSVELIPPKNTECAEHLRRLGVQSFFSQEEGAETHRDTNIPANRVKWPPGDEGERILEVLAPRADLAAGMFSHMAGCLDEVILNGLTHAESPIDCIVVGQAFPKIECIEVAVLDLGKSIRSHLASNPKHSHVRTDREAILLAMEDGVTGTPAGQSNLRGQPNSGAGLYEIRRYCESGGGELTVLSGDCWVTYTPGEHPVIGTLRTRFQGCLVNIRYFTGSSLSISSVEAIL